MKAWKIKLTALTPFLIGSHKIVDNHLKTLNYIPANVLQAAFSKAILESNNRYDVNESNRRYYINSNDESIIEGCRNEWKTWAKAFDHLSFSDAHPMGVTPFTPTTFGCKTYGDAHPYYESLPERYRLKDKVGQKIKDFKCSDCHLRLERKDGWMWKEGEKFYSRAVTRVEIDNKRLVGEDSQLYSLEIGEPYSFIDLDTQQTRPFYFEAICYADSNVDLSFPSDFPIEIHVGAYTTTGMGLMSVEVTEHITPLDSIKQTIGKWQHLSDSSDTIAIQLLSDLPLDIVYENKEYRTIGDQLIEYTNWLHRRSNLLEEATIDFAYVQSFTKRSFAKGQQTRSPKLKRYLQGGSVFVIKYKNEEAVISWLKETILQGLPLVEEGKEYRFPIKLLSGTFNN